ncbi:MAG: type II toxin-antitoxin system RelE/ParE family toxin [Woeseia sp.]
MIEIEEYLHESGQSPFADWFSGLDARAAAKVVVALERIERHLMGDVRPVGEGVSERRIDLGPGYRFYFGSIRDEHRTTGIVLLCGGTKRRQKRDIKIAKSYWKTYKGRKRNGEL